jgi:GNAT superfamily N-acetyltransferase
MQATTVEIGARVAIRPLARADRDALAEAFSRLSEETRRRRFRGLASRLGERELDRLTRIDHHEHEALAAIAPDTGRIVGVARYVVLPHDPGAAEVAVAVDDEWQRRGIGRRLMSELVGRARAEGVTRLLAYVGADNQLVLGWIARVGGVPVARDGDATVYSIPLDRPGQERRAA